MHLRRTLQKSICPWHVHQTLTVMEILVEANPNYSNHGSHVIKYKNLTNPSFTPEDLVITTAEYHTRALETSIPQHLWVSTIQALKDLLEVFMDAAHKYSNNPAIHMPNAPPMHPH
jgi:hypothetical protein